MYVVAGVTGHVGSVAAETLLAQGKPVRVIVRDAARGAPWKQKGAEVAIATFGDAAAITSALTGAAGAFLLIPPAEALSAPDPIAHNAKVSAALAAAIRAAKLPHVVLLSSVGAQHPDGTGPIKALYRAERDLTATGAAITAVRAAFFQENWGLALAGLPQGVLPTFVPKDIRFAQVATRDIGRAVAAAVVEGATPGLHVIELSGPRDYTAADAAAALATLTGKPVVAQEAPLDAVVPTFASVGIARPAAELYREMYAGLASGRVAFEGGSARQLRGTVELAETLSALLGHQH